jgi:hypothetical protein
MGNTRYKFCIKRPCLPIVMAIFLCACGGSGGAPASSADLYGAYGVTEGGMSFAQVRAIVGSDPARITGDGPGTTLYAWETDRGTYKFTTLFVTFTDGKGVVRKVITGPNGNQSQSFQ